jgi:hypothetical protein
LSRKFTEIYWTGITVPGIDPGIDGIEKMS